MPTFEVTQTQTVTYTWHVEADNAEEAAASDQNGVPACAISRLRQSDTDAAEAHVGTRPDFTLDRFEVGYSITTMDDPPTTLDRSTITVRALDAMTARNVALERLDAEADPQIPPRVEITKVEPVESTLTKTRAFAPRNGSLIQ